MAQLHPKLSREQFLEFLEYHFSNPVEHIGRLFLGRFFPGIEDPDVTEMSDVDECINIIDQRYVIPLEMQTQ